MNCDRTKEHLPFIDDGSLDSDVESLVREHIESCPDCRTEYEALKSIARTVRTAYSKNIPDNGEQMLRDIRRKLHSRTRSREIYRKVLPAAAVILLTVLVGYYAFMPNQSGQIIPQSVMDTEEMDSQLLDYMAEYHLDAYELYEIVEETETIDEYDLREAFFNHDYFSVSLDNLIETLDSEELNDLYVSAYN
jgi:hypothetical protein